MSSTLNPRVAREQPSSAVETTNAIPYAGPCSHDEDRLGMPHGPQGANGAQTIAIGQSKVDDDQIVLHAGDGGEEASHGSDGINVVTLSPECIGQ
jgi:hypothetical protein